MFGSLLSVLLASLLLPPVGLVLLWMRSDTRLLRKLLGSVLIAGWSVAYLALFFGLHYQLDGSGSFPRPVFYNKEAHFAELERSRAQQRPVAKVETATAAPAAIEEKAPKQPEPT